MLRSDWPSLACLLIDLKLFFVVLKGFFELSQRIKRVPNVPIRIAFAVFVACVKKIKSTNEKCCDLIGRHSPVCRAISKNFCWYSMASANWPKWRFASPMLPYALPSPALSPAKTRHFNG